MLHSQFFILNSSFFILHSQFFILHSSFFILHSLFWLGWFSDSLVQLQQNFPQWNTPVNQQHQDVK
ncbi:MAG TPA: hypothetical protein PLS70_06980 [Acidobacteriota bacterium]|nr:hypothetical protein [Acidobacteriota bacterium]